MKRTLKFLMGLIALVLSCSVFSSCSKIGGGDDSKKIVGSWKLVNMVYKSSLNDEIIFDEEDDCATWFFIYNFNADGTGNRTSNNLNSGEIIEYPITSWKISGKKIEMWEVEDGVKRFVQMDIEKLSDETLILSGTTEQKNNNGILKHYVKYTYNRI